VALLFVYTLFQVYGPALSGPFIYDDFSLPFYKTGFDSSQFTAWISGVRPLLMLSYWVNFELSGRYSFSYHLLNLLIHLLNSFLVFLIAKRLLMRIQICAQRELAAMFVSALFLLHPIQTESVAYVAGRSELLSAFFFLSAFAIFLRDAPAGVGWPRSASITVLFLCALATKEHAVTLPVLLMITDIYAPTDSGVSSVRRNWRLYLPLLAGGIAAAVLIVALLDKSTTVGVTGTGVSCWTYFLTECRVFWLYARLLIVPVGQNFDHDISWASCALDAATLASILAILALAALAWRFRKRFPLACYGLLVFALLLAPTSSFIPIKDAAAERRLYLPMLGFGLMACEAVARLSPERKWRLAAMGACLAIASMATYLRSSVWSSEAALWEDTIAKSPNKVRDYGHLVHGLVLEHRCREALRRLNDVSQRIQPDAALLSHWSFAYECVDDPAHALEKLQESAKLLPWPSTYFNIARHQLTLNRLQDAIDALGRALQLNPKLESAYLMRASILEREGDLVAAAEDYREALRVNPQDESASRHLQRVKQVWRTLHYLHPAQ